MIDKFTYEQKVGFLSNLVVKLEKLNKSYLKDHGILEAHKNKIDVLRKLAFFESKHHSLLENNNVLTQKMKNNKPSSSMNEVFHLGTKGLNEILDKCITHGNKWGLGYINKDEIPSSEEIVFVKGKNVTPNQAKSPKKTSPYTHNKKTGYSQFRCYTRFLKRFESQMSSLMNDFNSLKITSWITGKGIQLIKSLETNKFPLSRYLGLSKFRWEMIGISVKLSSMLLKLDLPMSGNLIVTTLNTW